MDKSKQKCGGIEFCDECLYGNPCYKEELKNELIEAKKEKEINKQKFIEKCKEKGMTEEKIKELCSKIENIAEAYVVKLLEEVYGHTRNKKEN